MGKFSYHSNNTRNFHPRSSYPGVSKRRWNERQKQREIQRLRKDVEKEMHEDAVAAAAAAAENGPSPAQSLRHVELLTEKADYLKKLKANDAKRTSLLDDVDAAWAQYEKEIREKVQMEKECRRIIAELEIIPAELSSSGKGLSETGNDIVEEVGANVVKQRGGDVAKNENEAYMKEKGVNVPKEGGESGSFYYGSGAMGVAINERSA